MASKERFCFYCGKSLGIIEDDLEAELFAFLTRKYVQRSDYRQTAMGLQYTEAETHDLAKEIARFVQNRTSRQPQMPEEIALKVKLDGEDLVIRLPPDVLKDATERRPVLEHFCDEHNDFEPPTVTHLPTWRKEVLRALNAEREDGTTLVHLMFDQAFKNAVEAGAEGIEIPWVID